MDKLKWRELTGKTRYVKGKRLTKKELNEVMEAMMLMYPKMKKENWKEPNQPKSIKSILKEI